MLPALITGGASILGGILGNRSQSRENRRQREADAFYYQDQKATQAQQRSEDRTNYLGDIDQQFVRMRDAAQKAGINPLTAMGAAPVPMATSPGLGGFAPSVTAAPNAGYGLISQGLATLGDELSGNAGERRAREKLETELLRIQVDRLKSQSLARKPTAATGIRYSDVGTPQPRGSNGQVRPPNRPDMWSKGSVPVITPTGETNLIPRKVAERLKLEPYDQLIGEDYEAIYGEEIGQGVLLPQVPSMVLSVEGGIVNRAPVEQRRSRQNSPWNLREYFPSIMADPNNQPRRGRNPQGSK